MLGVCGQAASGGFMFSKNYTRKNVPGNENSELLSKNMLLGSFFENINPPEAAGPQIPSILGNHTFPKRPGLKSWS